MNTSNINFEPLPASDCCALPEEEWRPDYSVTPRRIVCAANRHRDIAEEIPLENTQLSDAQRSEQRHGSS